MVEVQLGDGIHQQTAEVVEGLVVGEYCHILVRHSVVSLFGRFDTQSLGCLRRFICGDFLYYGRSFKRKAFRVAFTRWL